MLFQMVIYHRVRCLSKNREILHSKNTVSIRNNDPELTISNGQEAPGSVRPIAALEIHADTATAIKRTLANQDKTALLEEFFLESLSFTTMNDREEEVTEAHRNTFEFIFDESLNPSSDDIRGQPADNNFTRWLGSNTGSGVYWISGKAGSGKSTLMRFIWENPKTVQHLRTWAGEKTLSCARFYFWTSGNVDQRSQSGLLRYLLHQLLSQRKDMIPWVFPDLWLLCQDTKTPGGGFPGVADSAVDGRVSKISCEVCH